MLTKKWVIEVDNYDNYGTGEIVSSDLLSEGKGELEKMVIFDTLKEAEICSRTVSNEFQSPHILQLDVDESCCINYKEIVARRAKQEESHSKPCPFCGQQPTKMNLVTIVFLKCDTCDICLKEESWNLRRYTGS